MVYTMNLLEGKIEVPKPWRNKKRARIRKNKSQYIINFDEDFSEDNIVVAQ